MAQRRTREEWGALVTSFERSGQSASAFCASRKIRARTFAWWRWQLRQVPPRSSPDSGVRLLAVRVADDESEPAARRSVVILVAGVELRVDASLDVDYVAALVARLRRP